MNERAKCQEGGKNIIYVSNVGEKEKQLFNITKERWIEQSSHNQTYMGFFCKGRLKLGSLGSKKG